MDLCELVVMGCFGYIDIAFNKVFNKVFMNDENEMNWKSTYPFV